MGSLMSVELQKSEIVAGMNALDHRADGITGGKQNAGILVLPDNVVVGQDETVVHKEATAPP
jgi:hypothetical protein